jgi:RNA polymerase subunit RPABC4/transcription elongation factor Spt4
MDFEQILDTIQPFLVLFVALLAAFLTAIWVSAVIWAFRDIRSRTRDVFAQILATLMVVVFFPLFPVPGLILYLILRPRETLAEIYERSLEEEALLQGIEERLACPGCNRRIEEDYVVCPTCHTRLKKPCVSCGRLLHLSWSVCAYCGAAQTTTQTAISAPREPLAVAGEEGTEPSRLAAPAPSSLPEPTEGSGFEEETEISDEARQMDDEIEAAMEGRASAEAEVGTEDLEEAAEFAPELEAEEAAGPDEEVEVEEETAEFEEATEPEAEAEPEGETSVAGSD